MAKQVLRVRDVVEEYGLSRTSIWRKEKLGTFPKRVRLGAGTAVGWRRSDLEEWLKELGGKEQPQDAEM
jgi:prophage regulatory protein